MDIWSHAGHEEIDADMQYFIILECQHCLSCGAICSCASQFHGLDTQDFDDYHANFGENRLGFLRDSGLESILNPKVSAYNDYRNLGVR